MSKPSAPKTKPQKPYSVPALEKGLDILEALATAPAPLSQVDLARNLDRSSAEIFRMLLCLEQRAYVRRDEISGQYSPTLRLFKLAHSHTPVEILLNAAREPMKKLSKTIRENCHLSVIDDNKLLIIAKEDSPEKVRLSVKVGAEFNLKDSSSGRLLKSNSTDTVTASDESIIGADVAVARIGAKDGIVHAALAVSWLRDRKGAKEQPEVLAALCKTAETINTSLGI
jgi:DNA-binding IclR family transcriptional regulator